VTSTSTQSYLFFIGHSKQIQNLFSTYNKCNQFLWNIIAIWSIDFFQSWSFGWWTMFKAMIINECVSRKWRHNLLQLLCTKPRVFRLSVYSRVQSWITYASAWFGNIFLGVFMLQRQTGRSVKQFLSLFKRFIFFWLQNIGNIIGISKWNVKTENKFGVWEN